MWDQLRNKVNHSKIARAVIAISGAILMHYFPEEDSIIIWVLGALGVTEIFSLQEISPQKQDAPSQMAIPQQSGV